MRAIVLQHEEHERLGLFEPALRAAGFDPIYRFREAKHEDVRADLLVVLGGSMGVYEMDRHPFLKQELAVLNERLASDLPCLGICLGAQLMANALGSEVFPGKNGFEVGAAKVRWTKGALEDPIFSGMRQELVVAHWHQDTYKPVPDATLLASTDRYVQQAFRFGRSYAFQFHPELTASELGTWLKTSDERLASARVDPATLQASLPKLKASEPELQALAQRLADHFARAARS
jgi:GMP synthase (glutamine-hydrolysing)